ncbi:hypothetical protein OL229_14835 [Neisseriaceae bacterium JH1-16]|nr:hypothetical protein [Neisseriaceae bacterium JH1-16]
MRALIIAALVLAGGAAGLAWQLADDAPSASLHVVDGAGRPAPAAQQAASAVLVAECAPVQLARWSLLNIERDAGGRPLRAQLWASGQPLRTLAAGQPLDGPLRLERVDNDRVELACATQRRVLRLAGASTVPADTPPQHTALAAPNGN